MNLWNGRHVGPLLTAWAVLLAIAAGLYKMQSSQRAREGTTAGIRTGVTRIAATSRS
ncbi:MAG: hypothetical protein ACR2MQ_12030 [Gemmatimonadaceae bacterium]